MEGDNLWDEALGWLSKEAIKDLPPVSNHAASFAAPASDSPSSLIFVPRSFQGIHNEELTGDVNVPVVPPSNPIAAEQAQEENVNLLVKLDEEANEEPPVQEIVILSPQITWISRFHLCFIGFVTEFNKHNHEGLIDFIAGHSRYDAELYVRFWGCRQQGMTDGDRTHINAGNDNGSSLDMLASAAVAANTMNVNPFGLPNQITLQGEHMMSMKGFVKISFDNVPDSVMCRHGKMNVKELGNGIIRGISPFSVVGTSVMFTTLQDLQASKGSLSDQATYLSVLKQLPPEVLKKYVDSNLPIHLAVTVNSEVQGYHIYYFDEITQKSVRMEAHYFVSKWMLDVDSQPTITRPSDSGKHNRKKRNRSTPIPVPQDNNGIRRGDIANDRVA